MTSPSGTAIARPQLEPHAVLRADSLRGGHVIVFPEGVLVLNTTAAVIVSRCDGRPLADLLAALATEFADLSEADVHTLLHDLHARGLLRDADAATVVSRR